MKFLQPLQEVVQAHGATGATETFDATVASVHTATLDAACTFTFTAGTTGYLSSLTLVLTQDATGGRVVTWPSTARFPGGTDVVLSTAPSAVDIVTAFTIDGGTLWYVFASGLSMAV